MRGRVAVGLASSLVVAGFWLRPAGGGTTADTTSLVWTSTTHTLDVDGTIRSYLLVRPQSTSARLPVLVVLHGHSATPESEFERTGFRDVVGSAILVYPAGVGASWNAGGCCPPADGLGVDDVGFMKALVQDVVSSQPDAAPGEVFGAGYSNGARMVYRIACEAPDLFTGLAAVGAIATGACAQPAPVRLIQVAYNGDPELNPVDVDNQVAALRSVGGCADSATTLTRGLMTLTSWDQCSTPGRVSLAVYQGKSHGWPAGDAFTPSAQHLIWAFLSGLKAPAA